MTGTLAITGATGFVGNTVLELAIEAGWQVRALTRQPQPERSHVSWIAGSLTDSDALSELMSGADAVIHIAGITNAPSREAFAAGNVAGTGAILATAEAAGKKRFIHVSSLTAREPGLSNYGWSKAEGEALVRNSQLDWTIVRPPAVFGPGDRDHLDLFKAARWRIMPLPAKGRISVIEVSDLGRLLLALVPAAAAYGKIFEADDGVKHGWDHRDYGRAIAAAMECRALMLPLPSPIIHLGARLDRLLRGNGAKLTADRAAYFCHPDWIITPSNRPPPLLWQAQVKTPEGLKATAAAYRAAGWL